MNFQPKKKDRKSLFAVLSGICGNLAAGWFSTVIIVPGIELPLKPDTLLILTRSLGLGTVFLVLAFLLERKL